MPVVALGLSHSLFLDHLGSVWGCGSNDCGQLGWGNSRTQPSKISDLPQITSVAAGEKFSLFLDVLGSVWSCGKNDCGQLGLGDNISRSKPQKINGLPQIQAIHCLGWSSLFLDIEGYVYGSGYNSNGELGQGHNTEQKVPVGIPGLPKINSLSGGFAHSLFLDVNGSVWGCGYANRGILGNAPSERKPAKIPGLPKVKSIAAGNYFSIFLDYEGKVWSCGWNTNGELGLGNAQDVCAPVRNDLISNIVSVAGGHSCSTFLNDKGDVFVCGLNQKGQLGLGDERVRHTPEKIDLPEVSAIFAQSNLYLSTPKQSFVIVDVDGSVWSCGDNESGQLGLGNTAPRKRFEKISALRIQLVRGRQSKRLGTASIKDIFQTLTKQQNQELKERITAAMASPTMEESEIKECIASGVIPLVDWSIQWNPIHNKNQEVSQSIQRNKLSLQTKTEKLQELQGEVAKLQQEVARMKQAIQEQEGQQEVLEFFDKFLEGIVRVEKEVTESFNKKLATGKHKEFSVDEVSLFLNMYGIEELVELQREKGYKGQDLDFFSYDLSTIPIKDALVKKKLKFYLKVLGSGLLGKKELLANSAIWRHREVDKTLLLLKEWEIVLNEEVVRQKSISIGQLVYCKSKDFLEVFELSANEARGVVEKMRDKRIEFEEFCAVNKHPH